MYNLNVYYTAKDKDSAHNFFEEVKAAGIIEATRSEEGNLLYKYYFSAEEENVILLREQWKNRNAQAEHDKLPHLVNLGELKAKYDIKTSFEEI